MFGAGGVGATSNESETRHALTFHSKIGDPISLETADDLGLTRCQLRHFTAVSVTCRWAKWDAVDNKHNQSQLHQPTAA